MAILAQVLGATAIAVGAGLIYPPVGVIIAGVFAILFGIAFERIKLEKK
jgi:hypothetical protein